MVYAGYIGNRWPGRENRGHLDSAIAHPFDPSFAHSARTALPGPRCSLLAERPSSVHTLTAVAAVQAGGQKTYLEAGRVSPTFAGMGRGLQGAGKPKRSQIPRVLIIGRLALRTNQGGIREASEPHSRLAG